MSNLLAKTITIDSTMLTSYKAQTNATLGSPRSLLVEKVYWKNPAAQNDTCTVTDPVTGAILSGCDLIAEAAGESIVLDFTPHAQLWRDFIVTLSSGTLEIVTR